MLSQLFQETISSPRAEAPTLKHGAPGSSGIYRRTDWPNWCYFLMVSSRLQLR